MDIQFDLPGIGRTSIKGIFRYTGARFARIKLHPSTLLKDELWEFYLESIHEIRREHADINQRNDRKSG